MRAAVIDFVMIGLASCAQPQPEVAASPEDVDNARRAAQMLGSRLQTRLMAAMQEEGAVAAISVCAEEAPVIAREVSDETGYEVSRTALRVRNAANAPDRWEQAQLEDYIRRVQAGEAVASMETASVAMTAGEPIFRWAKPIDMKPLCATCHGVEIAPLLREAINARYPNDAATGFSEGEVRGIFTVQRALSEADG